MRKLLAFSFLAAISVAIMVGCPNHIIPLVPLEWSGGLVAIETDCEDALSVEIVAPADIEKATFTLYKQNSEGEFLPTGAEYRTEFGVVEDVTVYQLDVDYQFVSSGVYYSAPIYWWYGPYYYYWWGGVYHPVPWSYTVSHNLAGHIAGQVYVSSMEIVHGTGEHLFALFEGLSAGMYSVRVTAIAEDLRQYEAVETDVFEVLNCEREPPDNGCDGTDLVIENKPLFGDDDGITSGTIGCIDDPENWEVGVYARVAHIWPDPYDLIGIASIAADGTWWVQGIQVEDDRFAIEFYASLFPAGTVPPMTSQGIPIIPTEIDTDSVQRTPYATFVGNPTVTAGAEVRTNLDLDMFGAIAYVMTSVGRAHQQPLVNPADANVLVPLTLSADGTYCSVHIALNQTDMGSVHSDYNPATAIEVKVQFLPLGYDYVNTENVFVDNLNLNLTPQGVAGHGVDVAATLN